MKSSLGKLKKFALHKDKKDQQILLHLDGLSHASQDMKDMRECYDSLLSAAAAAANSAYEFSESLMEMGTCLLEKIALNGDGESGKALSMLGGVQLELQKLVDVYRSHIILTITNPSESLLSELRKVEEMKLQCDEKREVYEYMAKRGKGGKGENFTSQQLQAAREDYEETARLCIFRVQSLKQGQCRSLLTQAARHHGAQLNFFRKGLKSLESVEPQIRMVAENQHIDYQPVELDDSEDGGKSYEPNDDGELSFDYRKNKQEPNDSFPLRDSMEFDPADAPSTLTSGLEEVELDISKSQEQVFTRQPRVVSHSAPIFAEKSDISDRIKQEQTSARKFHTYVLPTPAAAKNLSSRTSVSLVHPSTTNTSGGSSNPWHSSPLNMDKYSKLADDNFSTNTIAKGQSTAQEIKDHTLSTPLPPPLAEGTSLPQNDIQNGIDARKVRRLAFSGPLASKPSSCKPLLSASGPIGLAERPILEPGLAPGIPITQPPSAVDVSYSTSPPLVSSPKISELHELPRPPGLLASKPSSSTAFGHSAPLVNRNQETSPTNQSPVLASNTGSPLPLPPLTIPRSFSIPSNNQRAMALHVSQLLESPQRKGKGDVMCSPPLTPISLSNASNSGQIRGKIP
ncbi:putative inactive shikimate kinase like 1, chloroplastic-like isoform X1 [Capsicum annuum]|nr:putative inactive shikimate kinase like 1, chloroplastic-like isoform X1 [Capsicum annuum]